MLITGLDLETTGLDPRKGHRIIETSMMVYDFSSRELKVNFLERTNPHRAIDKKAFDVHGISVADLMGAPDWEITAKKIGLILNKTDILVAHNGLSFDFDFLLYELERVGVEVRDGITPFDTMVDGRWATPTGKNPSLKELCYACDEPYNPDEAHAADYDVERMMACFWRGLDWDFFKLEEEVDA